MAQDKYYYLDELGYAPGSPHYVLRYIGRVSWSEHLWLLQDAWGNDHTVNPRNLTKLDDPGSFLISQNMRLHIKQIISSNCWPEIAEYLKSKGY